MRATPWLIAATLCLAGCGTSLAARETIRAAPGVVQQGYASYYSDRLAGRSTASGEPYAPSRLTAAHRSLPFGTPSPETSASSTSRARRPRRSR